MLKPSAGVIVSAAVLSVFAVASNAAERSFVGRSLSGRTFTDTEGHIVNPDHYRGSVLVMVAGIPW